MDKNIILHSYIFDDTSVYYRGCLCEVKILEVMRMVEELDKNVQKNLSCDIIHQYKEIY
jgi:hypothetical protein